MGQKIQITKEKLKQLISESVNRYLIKEFINDVFMSDNFKRWFNGSKIVDEDGKPLILGHATRSFGFNKFNTGFIHLAPINSASYFSGGNKRMFRFKNTINKFTNDEILSMYNTYFGYHSNDKTVLFLDDKKFQSILQEYETEMKKYAEDEEMKRWYPNGKAEKNIEYLNICRNIFIKHYNKNRGKMCYCAEMKNETLPRLEPCGAMLDGLTKFNINRWLQSSFPTFKQLKDEMVNIMFKKDDYMGKGGTYPLCARVLKPLEINCNWGAWDDITLSPNNCNAYDGLLELYRKYVDKSKVKGATFSLDNESIAALANELGYDGVIFHNIKEGGLGNIPMKTTYIVFSSKQLKSPFENNGNFGDVDNIFK